MDAKALEEQNRDGKEEEKQDAEESELKSPSTPTTVRPVRDRKTVERFSALSSQKPTKTFSIPKGRGTPLKDIPNVAFKLSKRKPDENLQVLHQILFGRRAKTSSLKRDINLFSGFEWLVDEEKQRTKTKEKLDKCVKEKLLDFCDVLDIPVQKRSSARKEELSAKLLDFLESPHPTTEILLAETQQKGKKRKRKVSVSRKTSGEASAKGSSKKRQQKNTKKGEQPSKADTKIEDEDESSNSKGDSDEDSDHDLVHKRNEGTEESPKIEESEEKEDEVMLQTKKKQKSSGKKSIKGTTAVPVAKKGTLAKSLESDEGSSESKEEEDEMKQQKKIKKNSGQKSINKGSPAKSSVEKPTPVKSGKSAEKSTKRTPPAVKKTVGTEDKVSASPSKPKETSSKQQKKSEKKIQTSSSKKPPSKSQEKHSAKQQGKPKTVRKRKTEPNSKELHAAVGKILEEVDFNTATLSDIVKQLGTVFGMDLMHKKAEVKRIVEEVMAGMSDDEGNIEEAEDAVEASGDAAEDTVEVSGDAAEKDNEDASEGDAAEKDEEDAAEEDEHNDETKEDTGEAMEVGSDAEDSDKTPDA